MKEIDNWLEQFRKIWEKRFDQLDDLLVKLMSLSETPSGHKKRLL